MASSGNTGKSKAGASSARKSSSASSRSSSGSSASKSSSASSRSGGGSSARKSSSPSSRSGGSSARKSSSPSSRSGGSSRSKSSSASSRSASTSRRSSRGDAASPAELARTARGLLAELTGRPPESVLGLARDEDGWKVTVEVVELSRVPTSTDVLGCYVVALDSDGGLLGYERVARYQRGQSGGGEQ